MSIFQDFLRWPFRAQKTHYEPEKSAEPLTVFRVNAYDTDSVGQVSGWIDRKLSQGSRKGFVDMQLPEQAYQPRQVTTTLAPEQVASLGWNINRADSRPTATRVVSAPATQFKQVFVWQPYERETTMPFGQMPTNY